MISDPRLHPAQVHVLYELRHMRSARFSELMHGSGMTSDSFKHHTNKLVAQKLVEKTEDGSYVLTPTGKEYANRLDETSRRQLKHPKTSTLMFVTSSMNGEMRYLMHRRKREPFYGFWGIASAPLKYGVPLTESSTEEFLKQTGLEIRFDFYGSVRVIDRNHESALLEDKLFSILTSHIKGCPPFRPWHGGDFEWLDLDEISNKSPLFPTTFRVIEMVDQGIRFDELHPMYTKTEY